MTVTVDDTNLKAIANAIRAKNGTSETFKPSEMAGAITAIKGGFWDEATVKALFNNRGSLTTIEIPTGTTVIPTYMFKSCTSLALTSLPSTIEQIDSYAFAYCRALALTTLPSALTTLNSYCFSNCTGLTTITFLGKPTSIYSNAFSGCSNLKTINVPWAEGEVANAPWGATNAVINYNYVG